MLRLSSAPSASPPGYRPETKSFAGGYVAGGPVLGVVGVLARVAWWRSRTEDHAGNEASYPADTG